MNITLSDFRFAVKPFPAKGERPRELTRTMPAHPLSYMELPYDPEYTLYNSRLTPEALNHMTDDEMYWAVRTNVIFCQRRTKTAPCAGAKVRQLAGSDRSKTAPLYWV